MIHVRGDADFALLEHNMNWIRENGKCKLCGQLIKDNGGIWLDCKICCMSCYEKLNKKERAK